LGGIKASPSPDRQAARRPSGGVEVYVRPAARALERYLARYGVDRERLADIVLSARRYGALNPRAFLRGPFTADDYRASPFVLESLRAADCLPSDESWGPVNDSGVCVVVTRTDEARAARPPVLIAAAQSIQAGPEEVYFGRPGLGEDTYDFRPTPRDLSVFTETGLSRRDVDGFYTYDAFASAVWFALERFGYCGPGEAPSWVTQERIWRDGDLPVNTNGGILAAGHTSGWAQVVEMVEQLRGEGGPRQIPGAELLHWGSIFGDSLLLTTNADHCAGR
jgi:acetyl-CoA acetyltransferase